MATPKNRNASAANALDLSGLSVETVDTMPKATRGSTLASNPFVAAVKDSKEDGKGRAVTVPGPLTEKRQVKNPKTKKTSTKVTDGPALRKVKYLLNQAANHHNLGVRIITEEQADGSIKVMFQGKTRKAKKEETAA